MFEDWIPCHHCKYFNPDSHWCSLFLRIVVDGCPNGEDKDK